ncbi:MULTISPECIES: LuxR family transcriptional regulator [unclassified Rhodococcus (in: high G+C Gram-positive bacteria)]|uniref:helix-turn-helix transcriptional regulator n=1 Tax=unclassified Rhodococcus (in: high G+C Gram-positive bacteria) TaxID=192944 RepID=UPI00163A316C|nr:MULTISPECIES: LuxR family transcriptional regulator [unclassified Rhodococcus (in: high G+C Gram-positive bacteria)]MBC2644187.1 hypothetical protein [Rhodococcus sp. 3A]MBC2891074.1 hypothetical protein [Rhodococcus sp. 4CII]
MLFFRGDVRAAAETYAEAARIGDQYANVELTTIARTGQGRCLIYLDEVDAGLALLDEAMMAVTAGDVSPILTADTYCTVIEGCRELFDLRRVQVWTSGLVAWCHAQPELVAFRGQCLVDRCEVLQLSGEWVDALAEARRACEHLSTPKPHPPIGAAHYQVGELHRLGGELTAAEAAYRRASAAGHDPQPGLALLRLAQGKVDSARTTIQRVLTETRDHLVRARLLPAYVEISLCAGDRDAASTAAAELADTAAALRAPLLRAMSATADGRVLLARDDAPAALGRLRAAEKLWTDLEAPYELARVRLLIAEGCGALGDHESQTMEARAARAALERLGAAGDLARLDVSHQATVLSRRESEVIRRIAAGDSNRQIAEALVISERTVERHVSNIFAKLDITSRAAATAYAYEHDLV